MPETRIIVHANDKNSTIIEHELLTVLVKDVDLGDNPIKGSQARLMHYDGRLPGEGQWQEVDPKTGIAKFELTGTEARMVVEAYRASGDGREFNTRHYVNNGIIEDHTFTFIIEL